MSIYEYLKGYQIRTIIVYTFYHINSYFYFTFYSYLFAQVIVNSSNYSYMSPECKLLNWLVSISVRWFGLKRFKPPPSQFFTVIVKSLLLTIDHPDVVARLY